MSGLRQVPCRVCRGRGDILSGFDPSGIPITGECPACDGRRRPGVPIVSLSINASALAAAMHELAEATRRAEIGVEVDATPQRGGAT
jgi:hypothetical protein